MTGSSSRPAKERHRWSHIPSPFITRSGPGGNDACSGCVSSAKPPRFLTCLTRGPAIWRAPNRSEQAA
jgi:hypothetical protein